MTAKPQTLDQRVLNRTFLARQMLLQRETATAVEAIERLNGLQAQEARPPFLGLWSRVDGFAREDLLRALVDRTVVKATFTRGTLHLVSAADYLRFRGAHAAVLEAAMLPDMKEMAKVVPVTALIAAARRVLADGAATFADLRAELAKRWPDLNERHMGYAVRLNLPLVATPDNSQWGGKAGATFALADVWLGEAPAEEAHVEGLIRRYLAAFGPATIADIQTWTGFKGLKAVVEGMDLAIYRNGAGKLLFDVKDGLFADPDARAPARFLPDFDGVMLGHADRARVISDEDRKRLGNKNLRVPAVFLVDGFAAGRWSLGATKTKATLTATPFGPLTKAAKDDLTAEGEALLRFVAPEAKTIGVAFD